MDTPSASLDPDDDAPAGSPDRRRTVVALGALAVAALGAGGFLLLGGSGDDAVDAVSAAPAPPVAGPVSPTPQATSPTSAAPGAGSTGRSARNPFEVLYTAPAGGAAAGVPGEGTGTVTTPTQVEVPAPSAPAAVTGAPAPAPTRGTALPSTQLVLTDVQGTDTARTAVFTVGGSRQTAAVGDSFGADGALLLLSLQEGPEPGQWTAVVQVGQGDPFDVVTGQPVSLA